MIAMLAFAAFVAQVPTAPGARTATLSDVTLVATIDTSRLKGEPTELAWSPDGQQVFLQTSERSDGMLKKPRNYVFSIANPRPSPVNDIPGWANEYWSWKSGKTGPGSIDPEIEISEAQRSKAMSEAPMGGSLSSPSTAGASTGTSVDDVAMRAQQMEQQHVVTLYLKGETLGEFVNEQFVPGYTFGWSPNNVGMIAYADKSGRLAIMDKSGAHQELPDSKSVLLPAWSPDGSRIMYLQRAGKGKYDLYTVQFRAGS